MHDRNRIGLTHQQIELAAGFFLTQVHAFKPERKIGLRWVQIDSNNIEVGQLRQKSKTEIPGDSRDQNRWFRFAHLLRTRFRKLRLISDQIRHPDRPADCCAVLYPAWCWEDSL